MHGEEKIKSECDFIGFKNNRLNYRCKKMEGNIFQVNKWINRKVSKHISILQW